MKVLRMLILFALIPLQIKECSKDSEKNFSKKCNINIDSIDFSFDIVYTDPGKYLIPGEQSDLDESYLEEIRNFIGDPQDTIEDVKWAYNYHSGAKQHFAGHVMSEIFVGNEWILLETIVPT